MQDPWHKRLSRILRARVRTAPVLSNHGIAVLAETKNGLLAVDPRDYCVSRRLLRDGSYDWPEISWLARLLGADSRIVFAGAHVGAVLVPIAVGSGSPHILAFEPSHNNHGLLMANLALNGVNRVAVRRKAVGDRAGTLQFSDDRINTGKSRISPNGAVAVTVTTLDAEIPQEWTSVDLLVMDTEGFEVHAIRGAMQTLRRTRYFYVEFSPGQLREQGSSSAEFIDLVSGLFESMYEPGAEPRFFPSKSYIQYLSELTANDVKGRLVRNFLFSNDTSPEKALLARVDVDSTSGGQG